ncbi:MAG: alpha/beta hydrolase [Aurantibacter sp.]
MEHQLDFSYRARYQKLGKIDSQTTDVWFVLHGYGQLSQYFIEKFEGLSKGKQCIIAPEGLSRFYLNGFSGRVGATWMTKEDRLTDIQNYLSYLNAIYHRELAAIDPSANIHLLGFSQGTATVTRWALQPQIHFDHLVLWAGMLPHDMDLSAGKKKLNGKRLTLVYGDQDEFVTKERLDEQKQMLSSMDLESQQIVFAGGHDIDQATLVKISSPD